MKVGDKVQYRGGAKGEIIRERQLELYYTKWEREEDERHCMCYLVKYTLPDGKKIKSIARPQDLILLGDK